MDAVAAALLSRPAAESLLVVLLCSEEMFFGVVNSYSECFGDVECCATPGFECLQVPQAATVHVTALRRKAALLVVFHFPVQSANVFLACFPPPQRPGELLPLTRPVAAEGARAVVSQVPLLRGVGAFAHLRVFLSLRCLGSAVDEER